MKHHQKKVVSMEDDRAKLFAMMMMYLSEESLDANQRGLRLKMKQMQKDCGS
jgi:hypothetical protein